MAARIATTVRNASLNALRNAIDAGSGPGVIEIRSGTQPANADTAPSDGALLGTITLNDPSAPDASGGVLTFDVDPIPGDTAADATGTASWARVKDSAGTAVFDGSVGTAGTDFIIVSTAITAGQPITLTAASITFPAT